MPKPRKTDRSEVRENAGWSIPSSRKKILDADARKYGFESRSALLEAFFEQEYSAFLYKLMLRE